MAWRRGNKSVEVELANVQSWVEDRDEVLDEMIASYQQRKGNQRLLIILCGLVPVFIEAARYFHWIP